MSDRETERLVCEKEELEKKVKWLRSERARLLKENLELKKFLYEHCTFESIASTRFSDD